MINDDVISITRHNPVSHQSLVLFAHTSFSSNQRSGVFTNLSIPGNGGIVFSFHYFHYYFSFFILCFFTQVFFIFLFFNFLFVFGFALFFFKFQKKKQNNGFNKLKPLNCNRRGGGGGAGGRSEKDSED